MRNDRTRNSDGTPRQDGRLFRLLLVNGVAGALLGIGFVAGALALDLGRLHTLIGASPDGMIALALFTLGSVVTFASVAMGGAIMLVPRDENDERGSGAPVIGAVPAPVRAVAGRRRAMR